MAVDVAAPIRIDLTGGTDQADMGTNYDSSNTWHVALGKLQWGNASTFNYVTTTSALPVTLYSSGGTELTSAAAADDAPFTGGDDVQVIAGVRTDVHGTRVSLDRDIEALQMNGYGSLRVASPSEHAIAILASQTDADVENVTGAAGDYLEKVIIVPESTSPGPVTLTDGTAVTPNFEIDIFEGGTGSVVTLHPFTVPIGAYSQDGQWRITTGAAVHVICIGNFG